ncbi:acyl carrier protein [Dactylosporangium sp. NPDC000555]|uniref:acyl carrier protein n=1 Tax=Dactylosporangium sp. NPDC000555 TaxID=3154260 RepID=UPI00333253A6
MTQTYPTIRAQAVPDLVRTVVLLVAPNKPERLDGSEQLINELAFHSLVLAELAFTLEDLFELEALLAPEQAMGLETVDDIVALVAGALEDGTATLPDASGVEAVFARYGRQWQPAS